MMRVYYELSKSPATFDYVNFLVRAEQERLKRQQDSISIRISYGVRTQSPRDMVFGQNRKMWRINNLLIPLSRCLPSVSDVALGDGSQTLGYLPFPNPQKPTLKAPEGASEIVAGFLEDKPKPVSITIRQSDFEQQRNSNIKTWIKVAAWLKARGYTPIMVPDAEAELYGASYQIGCEAYPAAALYPEIRQALYEQCVVNLMNGGGPMEMCLHSEAPVMIWNLVIEGFPMNTAQAIAARGLTKNYGPAKKIYMERDSEAQVIGNLETELPSFSEMRRAA